MTGAGAGAAVFPEVDRTLSWVVLIMRLLGWVWSLTLIFVALATEEPPPDRGVFIGAALLATGGAALMVVAFRRGFLASRVYALVDGSIALLLVVAGWAAGAAVFVAGGYPVSWLFLVAYAAGVSWTVAAGAAATAVFAVLHTLMDLRPTRVVGSMQLLVVGFVVGWAFHAIRQRESLRVLAERERAEAERELAVEQARTGRLQERSEIARRLHDSVLQTLKLISAAADDPTEVRYLARVQERDLTRTINEYRSPYKESFRAALLDARAMVEDLYRVRIDDVINDDTEMTPRLRALVEAASEAMTNAARHSGSETIDLFARFDDEGVVMVSVRDHGRGFNLDTAGDGGGIVHSMKTRLAALGGNVHINSRPEQGTEVRLSLPGP